MIFNLLVWIAICVVCYFIYKKLNEKIGDDPEAELTTEEKLNASVNNSKITFRSKSQP